MWCLLAVVACLKARHGAVEDGRNESVLYAVTAVFETTYRGFMSCGGEGSCLGGS